MLSMIDYKTLNDHGPAKSNKIVAMHLQVLPQTIPLLWQLNNHKHVGSISELLRCFTITVVNFNLLHTQIFRQWRKSHSLLDDLRIREQSVVFTCI